jgi:hypothetical protein
VQNWQIRPFATPLINKPANAPNQQRYAAVPAAETADPAWQPCRVSAHAGMLVSATYGLRIMGIYGGRWRN